LLLRAPRFDQNRINLSRSIDLFALESSAFRAPSAASLHGRAVIYITKVEAGPGRRLPTGNWQAPDAHDRPRQSQTATLPGPLGTRQGPASLDTRRFRGPRPRPPAATRPRSRRSRRLPRHAVTVSGHASLGTHSSPPHGSPPLPTPCFRQEGWVPLGGGGAACVRPPPAPPFQHNSKPPQDTTQSLPRGRL
jgi:hypothetical protein